MSFLSKIFGKKNDSTTPVVAAPTADSSVVPQPQPTENVTNENPASGTPSEFAPTQPTSPPAVSATPEASVPTQEPTSEPVPAPTDSVPTDGVVAQPPEVMPSPNNSVSESTDSSNNPPVTSPTDPVA